MKKSILNLKGAQELTKNEQKSVIGGVTQQCASQGSPLSFGVNCSSIGLTQMPGCPRNWCN